MTEAYDVCGPLPTGVTVLEASAGTGKTFTIAALAARYVAEGTPLADLLLVTFTRMATGELRDRVRERLVSAELGLSRALQGAPPEDDDVVALLADGPRETVELRRSRLARALADFDAATIATTHSFCQEVLAGLGTAGNVDPDTEFAEDLDDLLGEVVDDLYLRRFHPHGRPQFTRREAMKIARAAMQNPDAPLEPRSAPDTTVAAMRVRLADAVRGEMEHRKQAMAVMGYDDLLTRLKDALQEDAAAERLRRRYRVVLVDEFQDTDPVQWEILQRAFGTGESTLVLIGDPKQAIYSFRGADVYAYLLAKETAGAFETLVENWRSDQPLLDAYDALFANAKLGHEGIEYRRVRAAADRVRDLPGAPLRVRVVSREDVGLTAKGYALLNAAREHVARDLAADVVRLLDSDADVAPGDIAVLVHRNRAAADVRDALDEVGVPAVINGAGSVFGTPQAREWLRLLEALERPASSPRARSAALTCFLGWSAARVAEADEAAWEVVHRRLHQWARILRDRGVAALAERITLAEGLPARVLAFADGERRLTDLRHVAQLLHGAATAERMGATALAAWLRERIAEADEDRGDEERSRRLESDADAVQVLTIHRSKGLEFPVVYCPYLWEAGYIPKDEPVAFHDPEVGDRWTVDVGLEGTAFQRHRVQNIAEQRGEDLRLAYVALTRARHQAVVWWAGSYATRDAPLTRLLFARDNEGDVAPSAPGTPGDAQALARFEELAAAAPGCISVEPAALRLAVSWSPPLRAPAALEAAAFDRVLDLRWRRTSYSAITAGTYEARVASEPEETVLSDEPSSAVGAVVGDGPSDLLMATPSLLGEMPVGVQVGTLVHRVFEATDFAAADLGADLGAELGAQLAAAQAWRRVELGDSDSVVLGLRAALETPLGPLVGGTRLCDVARADRLDELEFELPLVGGDVPTGRLTVASIGEVLRSHLASDDPLAGYAARLEDPLVAGGIRGYLTGSVDLVLRVRGDDGEPRFAIVDYKTNWLGPPGGPLTVWHHRPEALVAEMQASHYVLQALLYTVALHRYLRWRLDGYDPDRHLAGVLYLFVRGMVGPDTPVVDGVPCGVFSWRPPSGLVAALSDLLHEGVAP